MDDSFQAVNDNLGVCSSGQVYMGERVKAASTRVNSHTDTHQ